MKVAVLLTMEIVLFVLPGVAWSQNPTSSGSQGSASVNPAPVGSEQNPVRVSGGVMAGNILHKGSPVYPRISLDAHVSGAVVIAIVIDREGRVVKANIVSGPEALREATLTAVRQWTYKPFQLEGHPVYVQTTVTVTVSFGAY